MTAVPGTLGRFHAASLAIVGDSLGVSRPSPDALSPWTGLAVLCAYASASLLTGAWLLTRRDA